MSPAPTPAATPTPAPTPTPEPTPSPTATPEPTGSAEASPDPSPTSSSIYWGAWIGSHLTGAQAPWDFSAVTAFETQVGKRLSLLNFSSPFANCSTNPCTYYSFPSGEFNKIRSHGAIPFFSWSSASLPVTIDQPDFQLSDIVAGRHDTYIVSWAKAAKAWGNPFFLRFNWEMNGRWFPWGEGVNGNVSGEYVAAWRHVHDIFTAVGATNATWVWCPNVDLDGTLTPLERLYPGDAYVDWTCLDGYNWNRPWRSFTSVFQSTYDQIVGRIAPNKPVVIGETASTEAGGDKGAWISDMFQSLPTAFPRVRAIMWFEKIDDGMNWPVGTSTKSRDAFARGIASPHFAENRFGNLAGGRIAPP